MIIEPYTWYKTPITDILKVSSDTISIRVKRPEGYDFRAGQYAIVRTYVTTDRFLVRQYSFSSSPSADWLEFTIQHEPGGEVTSWLHEHSHIGTMLEISQSFGNFTYESSPRPLLFIAGRVGIAPFMSYLRGDHSTNVHVIYSVTTQDQACFWDELSDITTLVVTSKQSRVDQTHLARYTAPRPIVYLCGSRQFAESMQQHLSQLGLPPNDIKRELFTL